MLQIREQLPDGFLQARARDLAELLGGPSLIHLPGERERPLFVAILLHGNETGGLVAAQSLLRRYRGRALPRALSLFVANTDAAARDLRRLPEQPDWNRIWPLAGGHPAIAPCPETDMAAAIYDDMAARRPFAVVDVHNNNGRNPYYACVNRLEPAFLQLARRFAHRVLYFTMPPGTLTQSFAAVAPAVTLECGAVGDSTGAVRAADFLDGCLHLPALPADFPNGEDLALYRSAARVTVPQDVSIGVGDATAQLHLAPDLEGLNWRRQPVGTLLGNVDGLAGTVLDVRDESGRDCAGIFLRRHGRRLELARETTPAMLTVDSRIIRQDCLCYLLERLPSPRR